MLPFALTRLEGWTSIFTITFLTILLIYWLRQTSLTRSLPPGPFSWPLVGALPSMVINLFRSGLRLPAFLEQMSRRFGPIFMVKIGNANFVILGDYSTIKEAFQHPNLNDRPENKFGTSIFGGDGKLAAVGQSYRNLRQLCAYVQRGVVSHRPGWAYYYILNLSSFALFSVISSNFLHFILSFFFLVNKKLQ